MPETPDAPTPVPAATPNPGLDAYISAFHRFSVGREHTLDLDYLAAFRADPALVEAARAEKTRLEATRRMGREDFPGDHEGRVRHAALTRMLKQFDGQDVMG